MSYLQRPLTEMLSPVVFKSCFKSSSFSRARHAGLPHLNNSLQPARQNCSTIIFCMPDNRDLGRLRVRHPSILFSSKGGNLKTDIFHTPRDIQNFDSREFEAQVQGAKMHPNAAWDFFKNPPGRSKNNRAVPIPKWHCCLLSLLKGSFAHFRCQVNGGRCGSAGGRTCDLPSWNKINNIRGCEVTKHS